MGYEYFTIKNWKGVTGAADGRDLPPEVAAYGLNLDLATKPGALQGLMQDRVAAAIRGSGFTLIGDGTEAIFFNEQLGAIDHVTGLPSSPEAQGVSGTYVSVGRPSPVSDGQAVFIGMGNSTLTPPKWAGYIRYGQWGGAAPVGVVAEDVEPAGIGTADVAMTVETPTASQTNEAPFPNGYKYFYAYSLVYDGLEESPLTKLETGAGQWTYGPVTTEGIPGGPWAGLSALTVNIRINHAYMPRRVTAFNLYRAEAASGADSPDSEYTLAQSISLNDAGWTTGGVGDSQKHYDFTDYGIVGQTYLQRTDIPETFDHMTVHWGVSGAVNGYHFVTDVWHRDMKAMPGMVFRSKPYRFGTFDWSRDYLKLPTTPNALVPFAGRLYAFCDGITYLIDPDTFSIEDMFEGVGCFSRESAVVTSRGLFFCDQNGIYLMTHGGVPEPIGLPILKNEEAPEWGYSQNTNAPGNPAVCLYSSELDLFVVLWRNASNVISAWGYYASLGMWTHIDANFIGWSLGTLWGGFTGIGGEMFFSCGESLYELFGGTSRRAWKWYSGPVVDGGRRMVFYEVMMASDGTPTFKWQEEGGALQTATSWTDLYYLYRAKINTDQTPPWKAVRQLRLRIEGSGTQILRDLTLKLRRLGR